MADLRLSVSGEIDLATAPALLGELRRVIECGAADVVVDCADLTFIDSSGSHVFEEAQRALETQGRGMYVVNVGRNPRRVFEVLGLTDMLREDPVAG